MHWFSHIIPVFMSNGNIGALHALWTFPAIVALALIIAWSAESAQYFISQGLALALLAWFQTAPEFMVEADLAWHKEVHLMLANLTGSLRLLTGVGLPLVFFVSYIYNRKHRNGSTIHIEKAHSIEIVFFAIGILYLFVVYLKGNLNIIDGVVMLMLYLVYLLFLTKLPSREKEEQSHMEYIPAKIVGMKGAYRTSTIILLFIIGGVGLVFVVNPFIESMKSVAVSVGITEFIFIQWVSPFLSEFPEKLSAFYWAKKKHGATMGLMNITSSTINQLTLLPALLPFIYSYAVGGITPISFDAYQKSELLLTFAQCSTTILLLIDMRFTLYEASGMFIVWCIQFFEPSTREVVTYVFFGWAFIEASLIVFKVKGIDVAENFVSTYKRYIKN
jgi:cation:H+ antiporter